MAGSALTAFNYIAERSEATPGLWNSLLSQLSQNIFEANANVGGSGSSVYNAALAGGNTLVQRLNNAILNASAGGYTRVYVPASMYPYSAAQVSFLTTIQMVREGGNWDYFDIKAYGAFGDNVTDDTSAITAAVYGAAQGGLGFAGPVYVPPGQYLITSVVSLYQSSRVLGAVGPQAYTTLRTSVLQAGSTLSGTMLELGTNTNCSLFGLVIRGSGNTSNQKGIHGTNPSGYNFTGISVLNWADQGIHLEGAAGGHMLQVNMSGNVLNTASRTTYIGGLDLAGSDIQLVDVYTDTAVNGGGDGNVSPFVWRGAVSAFVNVQADLGQTGPVILGTQSQFVNCRGGLNQGHGWTINGYQNQFLGCISFDNSKSTSSMYDGYSIRNAATGCVFIGCGIGASTVSQINNGFDDQTTPNNLEASYIYYVGNKVFGSAVSGTLYNMSANRAMVAPLVRAANPGDVGITIVADQDASLQHFNTPLTANRTVQVSATGRHHGQRFTIVRTAASTGTFALTVSGTVNVAKALFPGQWCTYEYNGPFDVYMLSGFGDIGATVQRADGTSTSPTFIYSSENSLGWFRSANSVMALSYGGLGIKAGTNASCGTAVLGSNGSVNVATNYVAAGDLVFLTDQTAGGTLGDIELGGIRAGSGFTILSTSITDTSTVAWLIVRPT